MFIHGFAYICGIHITLYTIPNMMPDVGCIFVSISLSWVRAVKDFESFIQTYTM